MSVQEQIILPYPVYKLALSLVPQILEAFYLDTLDTAAEFENKMNVLLQLTSDRKKAMALAQSFKGRAENAAIAEQHKSVEHNLKLLNRSLQQSEYRHARSIPLVKELIVVGNKLGLKNLVAKLHDILTLLEKED